ncbi:MAG TPA: fumarylacetoacetate hydrolase family protein [Thermodesulfobacteriota bacterium]|nr:fumarylacetoacetate hydrolase family protein [Thermodesulfobacteriota bacterium]
MKFLRFETHDKKARYGTPANGKIREIEGDVFGEFRVTEHTFDTGEVRLLPPVTPTKIVAVGLNYKDHAIEMGRELPEEPRLFIKPGTSLIAHGDKIHYPKHMSSHVDYEGELALVIGKEAKHVEEGEALDYVLGYTCLNDVTARDLQAKDIQFTRAKGFDTFAPVGPVVETELDPGDLEISTYLNGERKQHSSTLNLLFSVPRLVSFISKVMTLLPGDIVSTGTPAGVGPMKSGDKIEVEIEGIGRLTNYVE